MSIPTYTPGYPPDGSSLGQTKVTIRDNLDGTFQTLSVDHQDQNETNPGYHTVIHFQTNSGNPPTVTAIGQLYTKTITSGATTDQALFFKSGGGTLTQLTGVFGSAVQANFGYTTLPGGIILQWGFVTTSGAGTGTYTFTSPNIPFVTRCANVSLTLDSNSSTSAANTAYIIGTPSTTGFNWGFTGTTSYQYIYWTAIGF